MTELEETPAILQELIEVPSPTGEEAELGLRLEKILQREGMKTRRQPVEGDRFNLLALTDARPLTLLSTHLDTVRPLIPFSRRSEVIRGRGACDAKGAIAAMILASRRLLRQDVRSFGLLFVVGEETNSDGARKAAELALNSRFVVVGEPTSGKLVSAQKGTLVFRLSAQGEPGHSAVAGRGPSAIHRMVPALHSLLQRRWRGSRSLGETTLNLGIFRGGSGSNVVAGEARAEGIFRIATSVAELKSEIDQVLKSHAAVDLEILSSTDPFHFFTLPGYETTVVSFGSDGPHLTSLGQVLMAGPGRIEHAHSDDEQVAIGEVVEASKLYADLVRDLSEVSET